MELTSYTKDFHSGRRLRAIDAENLYFNTNCELYHPTITDKSLYHPWIARLLAVLGLHRASGHGPFKARMDVDFIVNEDLGNYSLEFKKKRAYSEILPCEYAIHLKPDFEKYGFWKEVQWEGQWTQEMKEDAAEVFLGGVFKLNGDLIPMKGALGEESFQTDQETMAYLRSIRRMDLGLVVNDPYSEVVNGYVIDRLDFDINSAGVLQLVCKFMLEQMVTTDFNRVDELREVFRRFLHFKEWVGVKYTNQWDGFAIIWNEGEDFSYAARLMVDASSIYWFDNDGELMEIVIDEDGQWSLVDTPAEGELSEQDAQNICNARDLVNHCFKRDVSSENEPEILRFPNF